MRARRATARASALLLLACGLAPWSAAGCKPEGCLGGDEGCVVPSPCAPLHFSCKGGHASVHVLEYGEAIPAGPEVLASPGDFVLKNDRVRAVVDALDHPHYLAPSGGGLLDLASQTGGAIDGLNHVFQATGLLPKDAAFYTEVRTLEGAGYAAVLLRGHLDEHPEHRIFTRYEVRACEPGLRVRTEVVNLEPDPAVWSVMDGWYWGGASQLPFLPLRGSGTRYPELKLEDATAALRDTPFMASVPYALGAPAYACVPCASTRLSGFHDEDISGFGVAPRIVPYGDHIVFERFIAVADGGSAAPAVDRALELRRKLFGEPWVELTGRVEMKGGHALGREALATVLIGQGGADSTVEQRVAASQVTPDADGVFHARVPAHGDYVLDVQSFGRTVASVAAHADVDDVDLGTIAIEAAATLTLDVEVDGAAREALVFVDPADERTRLAVESDRFGHSRRCAPLLGSPHGGSPACNLAIVSGPTPIDLPAGHYDLYASVGPFATIAKRRVDVAAGKRANVSLSLASLPLRPQGMLSADFHVHGAVSFDSSLPELDRVRSMLAAGLEVIAGTDHDIVHDYSDAIAALGAGQRLIALGGVETTGHILFDFVPGSDVPQVVGHFNFWPLAFDPEGPWRGAPWDERAEPGLLFTRMEDAGWPRDHGVIELNHPWDDADLGRDTAFARAIGLDTRKPLPRRDDGSAQALFHKKPEGARYRNSDYHAQEVLNGTDSGSTCCARASREPAPPTAILMRSPATWSAVRARWSRPRPRSGTSTRRCSTATCAPGACSAPTAR